MIAPAIHIKQASLTYHDQPVFTDIHLSIPAGKWVALLGASGIGKSSLLRFIAGLLADQNNITGTIEADNAVPVSKQAAYMAQTDLLLPWLSVLENTRLSGRLGSQKISAAEAADLLQQLGLLHVMHAYPHQLSGGMRQRVALARTLIQHKPIILMDEPFSALDAITRYQLQTLAVEKLRGKTVLFITHDPAEAVRLADEIYLLHGQPASLKRIPVMDSPAPRDLSRPDAAALQMALLHELSRNRGQNA